MISRQMLGQVEHVAPGFAQAWTAEAAVSTWLVTLDKLRLHYWLQSQR
jgi:hypothetical protein